MSSALVAVDQAPTSQPQPNYLLGTVVSSLHRLKDTDNQDGGFFVFGDLSVKQEGKYKLLFSLYQMRNDHCDLITQTTSNVFEVYTSKQFPGLSESTFLTRSFSDQGVRLRLRKDSRSMTTRKRNATAAEYARKHSQGPERDGPRRGMMGRNGDDGPLGYHGGGGGYEQSGYAYETEGLSKRQRVRDDGYGQEMPTYAPRAGYHHAPIQQLPASTAPYALQSQPTAPLQYTHHASLARLETSHMAPLPPSATSASAFQSPSSRHSPHNAFPYGHGIQGSPSSTMPYQPNSATITSAHPLTGSPHGEYRSHPSTLYTNNTSADASPRTHPTPSAAMITPNSSTSPPDASNYTPAPPIGPGAYPQMSPAYGYETQTQLPPPNLGGSRPNGLDMHSIPGPMGLGVTGYSDVDPSHVAPQP